MYDVENEFVTRFWGPINIDGEWNEDDVSKIRAKVENSADCFFSIYWEINDKLYGIDIPYERFALALKEAGIKKVSIITHEEEGKA